MSQLETRPTTASETARAVSSSTATSTPRRSEAMLARYLSPAAQRILERYGRRTPNGSPVVPTRPPLRHARRRVAGETGPHLGQRPRADAGAAARRVRRRLRGARVLSGQDGYDHPDFAAEWNTAINHWQSTSGWTSTRASAGRSRCLTSIPELAVAEIERRAGDDRFLAVLLPASAAGAARLAEILADLRGRRRARPPVAFHTGGYVATAARDIRRSTWSTTWGTVVMQGQLASMVAGGMFDEIPGLRVVLTECGAGLGRRAALVARQRLGADARGSSALAAPAI